MRKHIYITITQEDIDYAKKNHRVIKPISPVIVARKRQFEESFIGTMSRPLQNEWYRWMSKEREFKPGKYRVYI
jgi:hypothetical protein